MSVGISVESFQSGFYGDPDGPSEALGVVLTLTNKNASTPFTFLIDRDGAKRMAALLLSHALSPSINQQVVLGILASLHTKFGDLLPDISSWTQDNLS